MYGRIILSVPPSRGFITNFKKVFEILGNASEYNWLLSYYDCVDYTSNKIPFGKENIWFSGDEFIDIVTETEIYFIWAVAMAFTKDISYEEVMKYPIESAEDYMGYLYPDITKQHPLAVVEIVPIDSTFLYIISESKEIINKFAMAYPQSEDLAEYNRKLPMNRNN